MEKLKNRERLLAWVGDDTSRKHIAYGAMIFIMDTCTVPYRSEGFYALVLERVLGGDDSGEDVKS